MSTQASSGVENISLNDTNTLSAVCEWINQTNKSEEVVVHKDAPVVSFLKSLKDGVALCKLVAKLKGRFLAFNKNPRGIEFMEQENFDTFITVGI